MQAVLLVDNFSRMNSNINILELKRHDITIISDLKELLYLDVKDIPIIILDGYVHKELGMSELILYKDLLELEYIFISDNNILLESMRVHAKVYALSTDVITYNMLTAAINQDVLALAQLSTEPKPKFEKIAKMVLTNPNVADPNLKDMAFTLLSLLDVNQKSQNLQEYNLAKIQELETQLRVKDIKLKHLTEYVDRLLAQTIEVNNTLKEYSFLCDKDVLTKVNLDEFKDKPNVIYFKEHGDFLHIGSFIRTMYDVLKKQYEAPTKVLWILDKNNPNRLDYVPDFFTVFAGGVYSKASIHTSDFLCTTSGYVDIIRHLCNNTSSVTNLIIIDSKQTKDCVLYDADYIKFDLCRTSTRVARLNLFEGRTLVNEGTDKKLSWDYYPNYQLLDKQDLMLFLANRPVIQHICEQIQLNYRTL